MRSTLLPRRSHIVNDAKSITTRNGSRNQCCFEHFGYLMFTRINISSPLPPPPPKCRTPCWPVMCTAVATIRRQPKACPTHELLSQTGARPACFRMYPTVGHRETVNKRVLEKLSGRLAGQMDSWTSPLGGFTACCGYLEGYQRRCESVEQHMPHNYDYVYT